MRTKFRRVLLEGLETRYLLAGDTPGHNLGTVDFRELSDTVVAGEAVYELQTSQAGYLTVQSGYDPLSGALEIALLDAEMSPIGTASGQAGSVRLDASVAQNETYFVRLAGSNSDVDLTLVNLVHASAGLVTVSGSAQDDSYQVSLGASGTSLTVNTIPYSFGNSFQTIEVDGAAGRDEITVFGTAAAESATLHADRIDFSGGGINLRAAAESKTVWGGGGADTADFFDSAGNDSLNASPTQTVLTGPGFSSTAIGIGNISAMASGGQDEAYLFDGVGNDQFHASPDSAVLQAASGSFRLEVHQFERVLAHSSSGNDTAELRDGTTNDHFATNPSSAFLYALSGEFFNYVYGFANVRAIASRGGQNSALFYDGATDDYFQASPNSSTFRALSGEWTYQADGFDVSYAYATSGGNDSADLYTSPNQDVFYATPEHGFIQGTQGSGLLSYARGFDSLAGHATPGSGDRAFIYDSPLDEELTATPQLVTLNDQGGSYQISAANFAETYTTANAGGTDVAHFTDGPGDDQFVSSPSRAYLQDIGTGHFNHADGFDSYRATAANGGNDSATFNDSPLSDRFELSFPVSYVTGSAAYREAVGFETVYAYSTSGGEDTAVFSDTAGSDLFTGTPELSSMSDDQGSYALHASGFAAVEAVSARGGNDVASLFDSSGDDLLVVRPEFAELSGDDFRYRTSGFPSVFGTSSRGGSDQLDQSAVDYFFQALGNWNSQRPVAVDDSLIADHGQASVFTFEQLLANDMASSGRELSVVSVSAGEIRGEVIVVPPMTMGFEYTMSDGVTNSTARVQLQMSGVPHHGNDKHPEHMALHAEVVDRAQVSNVAVRSGAWSDPAIWSTGSLPQAGDRVLIHQTANVQFNDVTPALDWLRIDGTLNVLGGRITANNVVGALGSTVHIGTEGNPVSAEVVITPGAITDSQAVGRGVIFHGETRIWGEAKTEKASLRQDALAGDSVLQFRDVPSDWRVGDELLVTATEGDSDEFRTITAISGNDVTLNSALAHSHTRPDGQLFSKDELNIYVANTSRSIVFRSADTDARGHFMIMHNPDAEISYAQFKDLGRTDKTQLIDDPAGHPDFPGTGTNPRGRYGLHLHRVGLDGEPVNLIGNVVLGSPGWGIVQHDSAANLIGNVVYDAVGAGIVAETGNEVGIWRDNLVTRAVGDGVGNFDDNFIIGSGREALFDHGFFGTGYWIQGGGFGILMQDNVAANVKTGVDSFGRLDPSSTHVYVDVTSIPDPEVRQAFLDAGFTGTVRASELPIRGIHGLEVYNSNRGIHTWMQSRDNVDFQGAMSGGVAHEFESSIEDYKLWRVNNGIQHFYSAQFHARNGLIIGNPQQPIEYVPGKQGNNTEGVAVTSNVFDAHDLHFSGLRIEGFAYGAIVTPAQPAPHAVAVPKSVSSIVDYQFANVERAFSAHVQPNANNPPPFTDLFQLEQTSGTALIEAEPPVAHATYLVRPERIVNLDGGSSYANTMAATVSGNGIVAYRWDVAGEVHFGKQTRVKLPVGQNTVQLTVWDDLGQTSTSTVTFEVVDLPAENVLPSVDGLNKAYQFDSTQYDEGWFGRPHSVSEANGELYLDAINYDWSKAWAVIRSDQLHVGSRNLGLDFVGDAALYIYGVDGEFREGRSGHQYRPKPYDVLDPPSATLLHHQTLSSNSWTQHAASVDLGQTGFEYIVVMFAVDRGDELRLKNTVLV